MNTIEAVELLVIVERAMRRHLQEAHQVLQGQTIGDPMRVRAKLRIRATPFRRAMQPDAAGPTGYIVK